MNRRDILKVLVGGAVALSAGLPLSVEQKKYFARLTSQASITESRWYHRLDVLFQDQQYHVDFTSAEKVLTEREVEPALVVLANHLEHIHGERPIEIVQDLRQSA